MIRGKEGMKRKNIDRVAVIGAGVSGISAAKGLLEAGIEPVVFEQGAAIGGVWIFDEALPEGGGPAYRSLRTNTSKRPTAFSDFPFADDLPEFPSRADITHYLNAYADHFHVREHIRFSTRVASIEPVDEARWRLTTADGQIEVFDAVFVCSGVFHSPVLPPIPGIETFTGVVMHSRAYTVPETLADQRVVVIGAGSSGTDVAIEASQVAQQLWLSVRGETWKTVTRPVAPSRFKQPRELLRRAGTRLFRRVALALGAGQPSPARMDAPFARSEPPIILKDKLRERISCGMVTLKPGISRIEGDTLHFADGTRMEADTLVCATGYAVKYPFLSERIVSTATPGLPLYRLVFAPEWPTLAFGGMFRLTGAVFPLSEMQARWVAGVWRGTIHLPSAATMEGAIRTRQRTDCSTRQPPWAVRIRAIYGSAGVRTWRATPSMAPPRAAAGTAVWAIARCSIQARRTRPLERRRPSDPSSRHASLTTACRASYRRECHQRVIQLATDPTRPWSPI